MSGKVRIKPLWLLVLLFGLVVAYRDYDSTLDTSIPVDVKPAVGTRGEKELRVCTQNLHNYDPRKARKQDKHGIALAQRISAAACDVVGLQEVIGDSEQEAQLILRSLAARLKAESGRDYRGYTGDTYDSRIRNGFLVAQDACKVLRVQSFMRSYVPKLDILGPDRHFTRGPVLVELELKGDTAAAKRLVTVVSFHFKSQWGHWKDPTRSRYELFRMEMAEGLKRVVKRLRAQRKQPGFIIALGDRNSQPDSASAAVLRGVNILDDFSNDGANLCKTSPKLETTCHPDARNKAFLTDLFASRFRNFGEKYKVWSFKFKGKPKLYDEIYIPQDEAWIAADDRGVPMVGVVSRPKRASDHSLMWVDLNW